MTLCLIIFIYIKKNVIMAYSYYFQSDDVINVFVLGSFAGDERLAVGGGLLCWCTGRQW